MQEACHFQSWDLICDCSTLSLFTVSGITSEDDAVERFREYLRIPTARPDPDYTHAVRFLLKQAYSIGLEGQSLEFVKKKPVVVLTWKGENPFLQSVLLNSHMDVVTVDKEKWNYDPFLAYMDESGDIFARGAQVHQYNIFITSTLNIQEMDSEGFVLIGLHARVILQQADC